jgi:hypothetical protein
MSAFKDRTGQKFGRLTVICLCPKSSLRDFWTCRCDCGNKINLHTRAFTSGNTKSCGCLRKETTSLRASTHHMSSTRIYRTWQDMKKRCECQTKPGYSDYGGRGIKVCERWQSFENFYADIGLPPTPEHSLDRMEIMSLETVVGLQKKNNKIISVIMCDSL